ncbi:MAG: tetratricopeptide repeat protein [Phycisphaerales bacterium]|nr:tetratricopeptide repeat protein [Phycisphaerales bacterium]
MTRLEKLRKLVQIDPTDPLSHYGVGLECLNQSLVDEAIAAFDGAIHANANYSAAYYHKARAQIAAGRNDDARATLDAGMKVAKAAGDWHTQTEMASLLETIE